MAEEIGAAFVSLIPSARGFSKLAQRELTNELRGNAIPIPVRPEWDRTSLATLGGERLTVPVNLDIDRTQIQRAILGTTVTVGADVPATEVIGSTRRAIRATEATRPKVTVGVDVDRPLLGRLLGDGGGGSSLFTRLGVQASGTFAQSFMGGLQALPNAFLNNPAVSTFGAGLGAAIGFAAAPVLATAIPAAISGAFIGGAGLGVIGIGAWILKDQPAVGAAAKNLLFTVQSVFASGAIPLIEPFKTALGLLEDFMIELSPQIREIFGAIAPAVLPLTRGLIGFIRGVMPGFEALVRAAAPFLTDLESTLPRLGQDIGAFFGIISGGGPGASQLLRDLLNAFGLLLKAIGIGIVFFSNWYLTVRTAVTGTINLFTTLGSKIKGAVGNLGSLLYNAGRNVVQGLIDGIRSMFGRLGDVASSLAQKIRNYLPFSPAKEGPLSGTGNPFYSGQSIANLLASGMTSQLPTVSAAADQLAGAVGFGGATSASSLASAGVQLGWVPGASGDQLLDAIRELIGARWAGDPVAALRST